MQSNNNNSNFLFNGVIEGSSSGIAHMTGPFSATTTLPHLIFPTIFPVLTTLHPPLTPTPANINPRDGIINYLIYQGLLTPDLSLTISPSDLNTILSNRAKPTSANSELFSMPFETSLIPLIEIQLALLIFQFFPNHRFNIPTCLQYALIFPELYAHVLNCGYGVVAWLKTRCWCSSIE